MANKTGEYLKPRPHVSEYYNRMKQRPSFATVFGPASSKVSVSPGGAVWAWARKHALTDARPDAARS
jgi:hypothetical protein